MNPSESPVTFEICPKCDQRTASHFFRTYKKTRLCNLCAHRAEKGDASFRAHMEDKRLHGGLGWLWEHIFEVALKTFRRF